MSQADFDERADIEGRLIDATRDAEAATWTCDDIDGDVKIINTPDDPPFREDY